MRSNENRPGGLTNPSRRHKRGYMMRSEKRTNPANGSKPVRRRRRGGFFYALGTLILSVILWPVGMILLWRRRLRWSVSSKLLTTIITLFICITLFGYGLTVQTDNVRVTRVQDKVNDFLDNGAVYISDGYTAICDSAVSVWNSAADLGDAVGRASMSHLADALDQGAVLAEDAREGLSNLFAKPEATETPTEAPIVTLEATETPEVTETPEATEPAETPEASAEATAEVSYEGELPLIVPDSTPDPAGASEIGSGILYRDGTFTEATAEPTASPSPTPTVEPTETPEAAESAEPSAEAAESAEPTAEATSTVEATDEPTVEPTDEPTQEPTAEPTPEVTATPEPTAEPEPTPTPVIDDDLLPKSASDATVYYFKSSKYYHMTSSCQNMSGAPAGTLGEAVSAGKLRCRRCGAPEASILEADWVVWVDENGLFHLTDECDDFTGTYTLMTLQDALAAGNAACETCKADQFLTASGLSAESVAEEPAAEPTAEPTVEPTAEPTVEPTPEVTATPEPTEVPEPTATPVIDPELLPKAASEATVYYWPTSKSYHIASSCKGMSSGAPAHTLAEAIADGKHACGNCKPTDESILEQDWVVWVDENGLFHLTDECEDFSGKWTLMTLDDALTAGNLPCETCKADQFMTACGRTIEESSKAE